MSVSISVGENYVKVVRVLILRGIINIKIQCYIIRDENYYCTNILRLYCKVYNIDSVKLSK